MKNLYRMVMISIVLPNYALAAEKMHAYLALEGGMASYKEFNQDNFNGKKPEAGAIFGIGIGTKLYKDFTIEANIHRFNESEFDKTFDGEKVTQKFSASNFGVNLKYTYKELHPNIRPYLNVGVGLALVEAGLYSVLAPGSLLQIEGGQRNNFSFNFGGGIATPINDCFTVRIGYQLFNLGKTGSESSGLDNTDVILTNEIRNRMIVQTGMIGLQYDF